MPFALRLLTRDLRSGELLALLFALIISVTTVTSISLFIDRLALSFEQESANLLAADRLISSDDPIPGQWQQKAEHLSLQQASRVGFRTMLFAGDALQLSQISAVTDTYPLKGQFLIDRSLFGKGDAYSGSPKKGNIWLSSRLASLLNISLGEQVEVGETTLTVSQYLVRDPGSTGSNFAISPRAVMNQADLAATQVIIPGSRVNYALLLAGQREALTEFESWVTPQLSEGQRWRTPIQKGERIGDTISKAESFLLLSGTLAVFLSGIAVALASVRYVKRHLMQLAVLKTLGATPFALTKLLTIQFGILLIIGTTLGLILGWFGQGVISSLLSGLMSTTLPEPAAGRLWLGAATGFVSIIAFCLPLLQSLIRVSPMSVLQSTAKVAPNTVLVYIVGSTAMFGLMCVYTNGWVLPSIMMLTMLVVGIVVSLAGWLIFKLGRGLTSGATSGWQIGFAALYRRLLPNLFQLSVFTLIIMLGLVLIGVKSSLIADWQQQLPAEAPNHYLFNVQTNQLELIDEATAGLGIERSDWYPMVRGRVIAANEQSVRSLYPRGQREPELYSREMNLTWSTVVGKGTKVIAGDYTAQGLSIEQRVAKEANLTIGDTLSINIGGNVVTLPITSIRTVDWSSMQPNFYLILPKRVLEKTPANFVSSLFISSDNTPSFYKKMSLFPTVSILNISDILSQIQIVISQLSQAIELVLICILGAGALVLLGSVSATLEARLEEGALLRVLGAKKALIQQSLLIEFGLLGLFAGLLAAVGAEASLYGLQVFVFKGDPSWHPILWGLGPSAGLAIIVAIGLFASRTVLTVPPIHLLREL